MCSSDLLRSLPQHSPQPGPGGAPRGGRGGGRGGAGEGGGGTHEAVAGVLLGPRPSVPPTGFADEDRAVFDTGSSPGQAGAPADGPGGPPRPAAGPIRSSGRARTSRRTSRWSTSARPGAARRGRRSAPRPAGPVPKPRSAGSASARSGGQRARDGLPCGTAGGGRPRLPRAGRRAGGLRLAVCGRERGRATQMYWESEMRRCRATESDGKRRRGRESGGEGRKK